MSEYKFKQKMYGEVVDNMHKELHVLQDKVESMTEKRRSKVRGLLNKLLTNLAKLDFAIDPRRRLQ